MKRNQEHCAGVFRRGKMLNTMRTGVIVLFIYLISPANLYGAYFVYERSPLLKAPVNKADVIIKKHLPFGLEVKVLNKKNGFLYIKADKISGWIQERAVVKGENLFTPKEIIIPQKTKQAVPQGCGAFVPGYPGILVRIEKKWAYVKFFPLSLFRGKNLEGWIPIEVVDNNKGIVNASLRFLNLLEEYFDNPDYTTLKSLEQFFKKDMQKYKVFREQQQRFKNLIDGIKEGRIKPPATQ